MYEIVCMYVMWCMLCVLVWFYVRSACSLSVYAYYVCMYVTLRLSFCALCYVCVCVHVMYIMYVCMCVLYASVVARAC